MSLSSPLETLLLPFSNGLLDWGQNTLFLGAQWHPDLPKGTDCWQVFKPFADALEQQGLVVFPELRDDETYDRILVLIPKQVDEAKAWLAAGFSRLKNDGLLIACAANDAGGSRLEKWFGEAGCADMQSFSKHKSRAVWARRSASGVDTLQGWQTAGAVRPHPISEGLTFETQPGLFSWDRIDQASRLLADHLPPQLGGVGADFGCGTGYLAYRALAFSDKIRDLMLVEADRRALDCAVRNIEPARGDRIVRSLWHDATKLLPEIFGLDFILMNPPFHTGHKTDIALGQGFIRTAASALKKGGSLSLVANNHLPYEAVLEPLFKNVKLVVQKDGFKVIRAVK